jgi:hypothetical protein
LRQAGEEFALAALAYEGFDTSTGVSVRTDIEDDRICSSLPSLAA